MPLTREGGVFTREASIFAGLYGGTFVGLIGGAVSSTGHPRVPQFDLNANDRFSPPSFPTVLLHNPLPTAQRVPLNKSQARRAFGDHAMVDLCEAESKWFLFSHKSRHAIVRMGREAAIEAHGVH